MGGPQSHDTLPNYTGRVSTTFKNRRAYFGTSWPVLLVILGGLPHKHRSKVIIKIERDLGPTNFNVK